MNKRSLFAALSLVTVAAAPPESLVTFVTLGDLLNPKPESL